MTARSGVLGLNRGRLPEAKEGERPEGAEVMQPGKKVITYVRLRTAIAKLQDMRCAGKCQEGGDPVVCHDDISADALLEELGL